VQNFQIWYPRLKISFTDRLLLLYFHSYHPLKGIYTENICSYNAIIGKVNLITNYRSNRVVFTDKWFSCVRVLGGQTLKSLFFTDKRSRRIIFSTKFRRMQLGTSVISAQRIAENSWYELWFGVFGFDEQRHFASAVASNVHFVPQTAEISCGPRPKCTCTRHIAHFGAKASAHTFIFIIVNLLPFCQTAYSACVMIISNRYQLNYFIQRNLTKIYVLN